MVVITFKEVSSQNSVKLNCGFFVQTFIDLQKVLLLIQERLKVCLFLVEKTVFCRSFLFSYRSQNIIAVHTRTCYLGILKSGMIPQKYLNRRYFEYDYQNNLFHKFGIENKILLLLQKRGSAQSYCSVKEIYASQQVIQHVLYIFQRCEIKLW